MLLDSHHGASHAWEAKHHFKVKRYTELKPGFFAGFSFFKTFLSKSWLRDLKAYRSLQYESLKELNYDWS